MERDDLIATLRGLQAIDHITAFSVAESDDSGEPRIWLSWVGELTKLLARFIDEHGVSKRRQDRLGHGYYFFGDELRPGSGLIRVFGGKSEGSGGTLTCLLTSEGGEDVYFAAAGHVLTDFWQDPAGQGSIYRYRQGYPPTGSTRFLGKVRYLPDQFPKPRIKIRPERPDRELIGLEWSDVREYGHSLGPGSLLDVAVVRLAANAGLDLKQKTTCYGKFYAEKYPEIWKGMHVMKCGSQETHWTEAVVLEAERPDVTIYGPDKASYCFRNQIILRDLHPGEACGRPGNSSATPFAVPGDSGALVVDKENKAPVGMLIAGSLVSGRYVVTPFKTIKEQMFDRNRLVMYEA